MNIMENLRSGSEISSELIVSVNNLMAESLNQGILNIINRMCIEEEAEIMDADLLAYKICSYVIKCRDAIPIDMNIECDSNLPF